MKRIFNVLLALLVIAGTSVRAQTTWYEISVPTEVKLNDIHFVNDQTGYIAGDSLTLLKTQDGGETWSIINHQGLPNQTWGMNIQDIEFVSETIGYATIENQSYVYKTTDGGLNWVGVTNNETNQCLPVSIYAFAEDDLFTGGSDCFQGMTINQYQAGMWTGQPIAFQTFDTQHYVRDLDFEGNLGLAAVNSEYILRSTDFGATWDSINSNIGNGNVLTSIMIANGDTCYAGYNQNGGGSGVLYSADAGLTWQEDFNSATFFYPAYYGGTMNANDKAYITAVPSFSTQGLIFERLNGSWWYTDVDHPVYAMDSYGTDVTWAVGDSGYVVTNTNLLPASVNAIDNSALTLYPVPAQEQLHIKCSDCTIDNIRIFSLYGSQVKEVHVTNASINVEGLPAGSYFLEVDTNAGMMRKVFTKL